MPSNENLAKKMQAYRFKVTITEDRRLDIVLPADFPMGPAEVIVLIDTPTTPQILAIPRHAISPLPNAGCWPFSDFNHWPQHWQARAALEEDENFLQLIAYVALRNPQGELWCYTRNGGDGRLDRRRSCGVGGHVEREDQRDTLLATVNAAARRELSEELGLPPAALPAITPQALIYEGLSTIGRVHIGVLFIAEWEGDIPTPPTHESLINLGFQAPSAIVADAGFEHWSRLVAEFLTQ